MSDVKRYDPAIYGDEGLPVEDGRWIKPEDYLALQADYAAVNERGTRMYNELEALQAKLDDARFAAKQLLSMLPQKRDWLDPVIERCLKDLSTNEG